MKLLRIVGLFLALGLLMLLMLSCADSSVPSGMKEASDASIVDYHLYVPSSWTVDLQTGAVSAYCSTQDPSSVNMMVWEVSSSDYSPEDWWKEGLTDLQNVYSDFALSASASTVLGGSPAMQYEWTGAIGQNTYRFLQVATVRNSRVYVFTFGTLEAGLSEAGEVSSSGRFESHWDEVQQMLQYFTFD